MMPKLTTHLHVIPLWTFQQVRIWSFSLIAVYLFLYNAMENITIHTAGKLSCIWYCSFQKNFPHFWLVKTTCIIDQPLLTKFGKNIVILNRPHQKFCHIEPMMFKMMSKMQPAAGYWTIDWENLGTRLCYFWWAEE